MFEKNQTKGSFIGFVGIPGVGKTALAIALATKLYAKYFIEPGEEAWPIDPLDWQNHVDELETWVCESNLKNFSDARRYADQGGTAVADAGIFLVNRELIGAACFDWYYKLLSPSGIDKIYQIAQRDWVSAPCPDVLVLIEADKEAWMRYLKARCRNIDADETAQVNYLQQQAVMARAAMQFAKERGVPFMRFLNQYGSPMESAALLLDQLGLDSKNDMKSLMRLV